MIKCMVCAPARKEPQADTATTSLLMGLFNVHTHRNPDCVGATHSAHSPNAAYGQFGFLASRKQSRKRSFLQMFPNRNLATSSIA